MTTHRKLIDAVKKGDQTAVAAIAAEDPTSVDAVNEQGLPAVLLAAYYGKHEIVEQLRSLGAKVDFWSACAIGDEAVVRSGSKKHVKSTSPDGFTPLCLAAAFGHANLVRVLLEAGADPKRRSESLGGVAPIHSAVFGRSIDAVRALLEAGADPLVAQEGGFTALHAAAQHGDEPCVGLLLEFGARKDVHDVRGKTPADHAEEAGYPELARSLKA